MHTRWLLGTAVLTALWVSTAGAEVFDYSKYPNLRGQWYSIGGAARYDTSKRAGRGQQAPLTAEYQAIYESDLADQASGGQGTSPTYRCLSPGMPRVMNGHGQIELVVTRDTTYVLIDHILDDRRIFTDGRDWPAEITPTFLGYSIGHWVDTEHNGHYDVLEVETRGFRGPRSFDATGIPLHRDNQSVIKERIYLDKTDPNVAHDEITVTDHALTQPWTVTKGYRRQSNPYPNWAEEYCQDNDHVRLGTEDYMLSADGLLMPAKKDEPPPDLRYFGQASK